MRAWAEKYRDRGLVVIGVHTPEFPFEREVENVREAAQAMRVEYPIALDSDYGVWSAFANRYWPAVYLADAEGRIRYHHFGEGEYDEGEWMIQHLLREAAKRGHRRRARLRHRATGSRRKPTGRTCGSPETYLGYQQGQNLDSPDGVAYDEPRSYVAPESLQLNTWALAGNWTIEERASVLNEAGGRIAFRFHARDVHLVLRSRAGTAVPFRVLVDGEAPGAAHGLDVDEQGRGTLVEPRLYQLIRQPGIDRRPHIRDRIPRPRRRGLRLHVRLAMAGDGLAVIDVVATEQEAEVICGLLRSAGIECLTRQTNVGAGASDGLSVTGPYEVVVRVEDIEAAREVLRSSAPEQPSE